MWSLNGLFQERQTNAVENTKGYNARKSHLQNLWKLTVFIFIFNQNQENISERTSLAFHSHRMLCIHAGLLPGVQIIQVNSTGLWLEIESDWHQSIHWMPTQGKWWNLHPHLMLSPKNKKGVIVNMYTFFKKHREMLWVINLFLCPTYNYFLWS